MNIEKQEYKVLLKKIKNLREEYNDFKDLCSNIESIFNSELDKMLIETNNKEKWDYFQSEKYNNLKDVKKETILKEESVKIEKDKDVKKIYREIVKYTHPDKLTNDISNKEKEFLIDIYKKITDSNNIIDMAIYAITLDINIDYTTIDKQKLESEIKSLKHKIAMFENSIYYKWYNSDKKEKEAILNDFLLKQMF